VALITGASGGLGVQFARVLHAAGASVVLAGRRVDRLEALADELGPETAAAVSCDMAVPEEVASLAAAAAERFGRVDVLVNNAGIGNPAPAEDHDLADWRRTVDVNLLGLFQLTQACARGMLERGSGVVINVASVLGIVSSAPIGNAAYAATKGAVVQLTRELAVQWARRGVRVNAIAPGWFPSEMTSSMFDDERSMAFVERNTPMGRAGRPGELDGALLFLASDASSYVTGHTLVVDGGWVAK
jgi:NAD(P)-dependent dehydrogenase (short-subunit alcohol dehydrogenase family)